MSDPQKPTNRPKYQRSFKNFLLRPLLQIQLGVYSVALTTFFSAILVVIIYATFERTRKLVLNLTNLEAEVVEIVSDYVFRTAGWLAGVVVLYLVFNIVLTVVFTHRMVGPAVAFKRHIRALREGDYDSRVVLRKGDAFDDVAEELNLLAHSLGKTDSEV
jgi:hypothetical protein